MVYRAGISLGLACAAFSIACSRAEQPPIGIDASLDARDRPADHDANPNDASTGSADGADGGGHDAIEGGAKDRDGGCATCDPHGGQYCGIIADECSPNGRLDCPPCRVAGFSCGGGGLFNICGAARDSDACRAVTCLALAATYCGKIGDGCGGTLDCGDCPPQLTCGGGGIPGVCGGSGDVCSPLTCSRATVRYCGVIGDGCGGRLDCGECPDGGACGQTLANMCGTDPVPIAIPPPAPIPPLPPAPPEPPVPKPPPPPTSVHRAQD